MGDKLSNCTYINFVAEYLHPTKVVIGQYFTTPVYIVGILGNILTLLVLKQIGMKSTNCLLSTMTVADLFYLLCSFPAKLVVFESLHTSNTYLTFLIYSSRRLTTTTNFFATISIW